MIKWILSLTLLVLLGAISTAASAQLLDPDGYQINASTSSYDGGWWELWVWNGGDKPIDIVELSNVPVWAEWIDRAGRVGWQTEIIYQDDGWRVTINFIAEEGYEIPSQTWQDFWMLVYGTTGATTGSLCVSAGSDANCLVAEVPSIR